MSKEYIILAPQARTQARKFTGQCYRNKTAAIIIYKPHPMAHEPKARLTYGLPMDRELNDNGVTESARLIYKHLLAHGIKRKGQLCWSTWGREQGDFFIDFAYAEDLAKELLPILNDPANLELGTSSYSPFSSYPQEFDEIVKATHESMP
jgi:hypothetical protein